MEGLRGIGWKSVKTRIRGVEVRTLLMFAMVTLAVSAAGQEALRLPFAEKLSAGKLGEGWRIVAPGASSAKVIDGPWLTFHSPDGGYAHVERPAGSDNITVTATLISLSSMYVVWGPDEWCGVGKISPTPFARFATTVKTGGKWTQEGHTATMAHQPQQVRIELGNDVVRFSYSRDGETWRLLRVAERPNGFSGAPTLVAFGANYSADQQPFGSAYPEPARGRAVPRGSVRDISVVATPEKKLRITAAERRSLSAPRIDPVTRAHSGGKEPTFQSVSPHYPPFLYPREVVGVPEHPLDIGVDYHGRIDNSPWAPPLAWLLIGDEAHPLGGEGVKFERKLLDGYLPVVTLSTSRKGVRYEMTVFGWSEGLSPEKDLYACARLTCAAGSKAALPTKLQLAYGDGSKPIPISLRAQGARASAFFKFKHPEPAGATDIERAEFDALFSDVAEGWRKRLAPAELFSVPDERVQNAYRAWLAYSMLNADRIDGRTEVHDGAGFYDIMFGNSVSLYAMAVDMYGLHDYAERILDAQLHFQRSDGLYVQECGLPDHGALLIALAEHYRITGNRPWLERVAPAMTRACEWLMRQRSEAPADGLTRGLIKFRPYNDYPEPVFNYTGNANACEGLRLAAEVLAALGSPDAPRFAAQAVRFRSDILDSMKKATLERDGMKILPIEPDTHRLLKLSDYQGGAYYGLQCSMLLDTGFLSALDPPARMVVESLERRGGLIAGICDFMEGIDHAYTYGYLMTQMKRGDVQKVLLGFWGFLAFGMTRDTYSPVEVHMIATGENHLTLPHTYSCTQQLRLLRNMLVREEGDRLCLLDAVPEAWLAPGKVISADAAPTRFGPVSFKVSSQAKGTVRIRVSPPERLPAGKVSVRLRVPGYTAIASVEGGRGAATYYGNVLTLDKPQTDSDLIVRMR